MFLPCADLKRSGLLDGGPKITLPGDDPANVAVSPSAPVKRKEAVVLSKPRHTIANAGAAVKQFRGRRAGGRRRD